MHIQLQVVSLPRQLSWTEQQISNLWVVGSNPTRGTKYGYVKQMGCATVLMSKRLNITLNLP